MRPLCEKPGAPASSAARQTRRRRGQSRDWRTGGLTRDAACVLLSPSARVCSLSRKSVEISLNPIAVAVREGSCRWRRVLRVGGCVGGVVVHRDVGHAPAGRDRLQLRLDDAAVSARRDAAAVREAGEITWIGARDRDLADLHIVLPALSSLTVPRVEVVPTGCVPNFRP